MTHTYDPILKQELIDDIRGLQIKLGKLTPSMDHLLKKGIPELIKIKADFATELGNALSEQLQECEEPKPDKPKMIHAASWKEFKDAKLLWFINMQLHLFGWAIALDIDDNGDITGAFPAKTKFRGFSEELNDAGYQGLTEHLIENKDRLLEAFIYEDATR